MGKTKHGYSKTAIYVTWKDVKKRCKNPKCPSYRNYGGRGIKICDEWENDFLAFYKYVSALPHYGEDGYSLDRINNDGNYEPNNLRWATKTEQSRNRRTCVFYEINGNRIHMKELAALLGIPYPTIQSRHWQHRPMLTEAEKEKLLKII